MPEQTLGRAALSTTPIILVDTGAALDVSAVDTVAGNVDFTLADGQTLSGGGTIVGEVVTAAGSSLPPGGMMNVGVDTYTKGLGTMTVTGHLTLGGSLEIEYDGNADPAVDCLDVSGDLVILSSASFDFECPGDSLTAPSYMLATFNPGGLIGTATENNVPEGYQVAYDNLGGTITPNVIPEPSTITLLVLAAVGCLVWNRRTEP